MRALSYFVEYGIGGGDDAEQFISDREAVIREHDVAERDAGRLFVVGIIVNCDRPETERKRQRIVGSPLDVEHAQRLIAVRFRVEQIGCGLDGRQAHGMTMREIRFGRVAILRVARFFEDEHSAGLEIVEPAAFII